MAKGDLHKKLLAIAGELGAMAKDKNNPHHHYNYVSAEAFIAAVRVPMLANGVLIMPRITATWEAQPTSKGTPGVAAHTNAVYVVTDGVEEFEVSVPGEGWDSQDKAVYKALTGGYKYLLRILFCLPMEDDPEKDASSGQSQSGGQRQSPPQQQQRSPPSGGGGGGVEAQNRAGGDEGGFEMDHYPAHKSGAHVFSKGPNANRWNGMVWRDLQEWHRTNPGDSPLVAIYESEYMALWNKQHAAYLAQQIDANTPAAEPQTDNIDTFNPDDPPF